MAWCRTSRTTSLSCIKTGTPRSPINFATFFLQNLWNHAEVKDCGLHQQRANSDKHLYITSASKQAKVEVAGRGKLPVREVFKKVEGELRRLEGCY